MRRHVNLNSQRSRSAVIAEPARPKKPPGLLWRAEQEVLRSSRLRATSARLCQSTKVEKFPEGFSLFAPHPRTTHSNALCVRRDNARRIGILLPVDAVRKGVAQEFLDAVIREHTNDGWNRLSLKDRQGTREKREKGVRQEEMAELDDSRSAKS